MNSTSASQSDNSCLLDRRIPNPKTYSTSSPPTSMSQDTCNDVPRHDNGGRCSGRCRIRTCGAKVDGHKSIPGVCGCFRLARVNAGREVGCPIRMLCRNTSHRWTMTYADYRLTSVGLREPELDPGCWGAGVDFGCSSGSPER
jgi:hypothetical protein